MSCKVSSDWQKSLAKQALRHRCMIRDKQPYQTFTSVLVYPTGKDNSLQLTVYMLTNTLKDYYYC